jgi:hypothetical protein
MSPEPCDSAECLFRVPREYAYAFNRKSLLEALSKLP